MEGIMFDSIATAFQHGGFWMYPILALQVVTIAIMAERVYALYMKRKGQEHIFVKGFEDNIRRGELETVIQKASADQAQHPIAAAVVAGAQAAATFGGRDEIQGKMDEVLLHENSQLDKRVGFLSLLANVATLVGLLGTITGMIKSFAAVAFSNPAEKAALLAAGISEAMNATAYGLIVAIPALLAYAVFNNRANHLAEDLNQSALKVFNWLSFAFDPVSLRSQTKMNKTKTQSSTPEMNA
jgi:biopolymer transport protein ExbB